MTDDTNQQFATLVRGIVENETLDEMHREFLINAIAAVWRLEEESEVEKVDTETAQKIYQQLPGADIDELRETLEKEETHEKRRLRE